MPTLTLTFTLPEEQSEADLTLRSAAAHEALWQIDEYCRTILKHGEPSAEVAAILEAIRKAIPWECIK